VEVSEGEGQVGFGIGEARGSRSWEPLLDSTDQQLALEYAAEVARDIGREGPLDSNHERRHPHSLAYGAAGLALFLDEAAHVLGRPEWREDAHRHLESCCNAMSTHRLPVDYMQGLAGIGWVLERLRGRVWQPDEGADPNIQIDEVIRSWALRESTPTEFMHGLGGAFVYAEERFRTGRGSDLLTILAEATCRQAEKNTEGCAFPMHASIARHVREEFELLLSSSTESASREAREAIAVFDSRGVYKFGAAHGVAGVGASLALAVEAGVPSVNAHGVLQGLVAWIARQRLPERSDSVFPVVYGISRVQSQTGWCNGDLGIASSLVLMGQAAQHRASFELGAEVARQEANMALTAPAGYDHMNPNLCHGQGGRAHLYNVLYQATNDALLAESARRCYRNVINMWTRGQGYGGFVISEPAQQASNVKGVLMGSAGVALSLLAAASPSPPSWDRILLAPH